MGKSKALVFLIILDKLQYGGITPEQATSPDKNINKGIRKTTYKSRQYAI